MQKSRIAKVQFPFLQSPVSFVSPCKVPCCGSSVAETGVPFSVSKSSVVRESRIAKVPFPIPGVSDLESSGFRSGKFGTVSEGQNRVPLPFRISAGLYRNIQIAKLRSRVPNCTSVPRSSGSAKVPLPDPKVPKCGRSDARFQKSHFRFREVHFRRNSELNPEVELLSPPPPPHEIFWWNRMYWGWWGWGGGARDPAFAYPKNNLVFTVLTVLDFLTA